MVLTSKRENPFRQLDFSKIEDDDPSLINNYILVYKRDCPFEIRSKQKDTKEEIGSLEAMKVRIFVKKNSQDISDIKIELINDNDLFFHYIHEIDLNSFSDIKQEQDLLINFNEYPSLLMQTLNDCVNASETHIAILIIKKDKAQLNFLKSLKYKFVELMKVDFKKTSEEVAKKLLTYRFKALKTKLVLTEARIEEIKTVLKVKNPPLYMQLTKKKKDKI